MYMLPLGNVIHHQGSTFYFYVDEMDILKQTNRLLLSAETCHSNRNRWRTINITNNKMQKNIYINCQIKDKIYF